jgi:two-component system chemotaxis sensor kinase CheA
MDPLLEQFLSEARENLAFIDQNIGEIGGEDPELLNSIFRAAHTLKGGSGIVGFESVKNITHHAEDLLDMLRSGKLEFQDSMTDALYDAFDEVMNLIEAAEESGDIVEADEKIVDRIVAELKEQMGKSSESEDEAWQVPFNLVSDKSSIINISMKTLRGVDSIKIPFQNAPLNQDFCENENFYAVVFDVDDSCMVYGNDPIYALTLLDEKVVGIFSCMSEEDAKAVLSGTEDEDGLLLKSHIIAFVYARYEDIEDSLFNFIDELELLPLDINTLLTISTGDTGHKIDSLKELSNIAEDFDLSTIKDEVQNSMELIGVNTIQYAQLQRFLDIAGLIDDKDTTKLKAFFENIYKGEVYFPVEVLDDIKSDDSTDTSMEDNCNVEVEDEIDEDNIVKTEIELTESIQKTITNIYEQQYRALEYVDNEEDALLRVISILNKTKKFVPELPELNSKNDVKNFIESYLGLEKTVDSEINEQEVDAVVVEEVKQDEQIEQIEVKNELKEEAKESSNVVVAKKQPIKDDAKKAVVGKTVKIDQESIDSLMNVVGELLVAKNSLPYLADNVSNMTHELIKREIMEKYIFINRLSEQLQDLIMGMRMLPVSYVFDRYPKLVRDIAKKLGKKVKLEMFGSETKLDKNMIEMLADPLIHIMRNSLDHGIEMPEVREQKGKNPTGTVSLNAYAQSDRIIIEIKDDGAGINVDRVANKVLEKGLMTPEQIDALSEDEKAELVMLPGLSTAEEITEFSGRGVGMDVVKKSIESFGGSITISTKANQGTVITLAIPMSLAVTSLLHIQMNDIHYGIPMDSVSETVKLDRSEIEYLHNEPFVYIRGDVIPLLFIKSMLNEEVLEGEPLSIVVLNIKDNLLAVVVNEFLGQLDVVQKPLVGIMEGHPLFSGTALLGNGQIIMAIDPLGLLSISQKLKEDIKVA